MKQDSPSKVRRVAVFRPDDERLSEAVTLLESLDVVPIPDPLLAVQPTGAIPRTDADIVIFTSKTGVELADHGGWVPNNARVCAIGDPTAAALRAVGWRVDLVPEEHSSGGLVDALVDSVDGLRIEVARSDHGSPLLTDGLEDAGGYVHETVLYELVRPEGAGHSTELAAQGSLDGALFTSSLTVVHFVEAATERGICDAAIDGLNAAVVGAIGEPTRTTAEVAGISVDVVPSVTRFEMLAREAVGPIISSNRP